MTEAQAIHKVYQIFKDAGETATADFLTSYIFLGNNIPSISHILYDIDNLFKVNFVSNALDIVNELNLKSSSATEAVAKIKKLSKLVVGGNVTIRDIFMAQPIKDNIPDGGKIALINTLAYLDRESEIMCFTEFKSTFKQTFAATPHETFFGQNISKDYNSKEPRAKNSGSNRSHSRSRRGHSNNRSGFTAVSFHITGPGNSTFLIDTQAQRSCMGQQTFVSLGANLQSLS